MALSDMTVRQARITGNDYTLGDTDGLALIVTAHGGKIWRFRYCWLGKQRRMSLGSFRKSASETPVRNVTRRVPWLPKVSTPMSTVNSSAALSALR